MKIIFLDVDGVLNCKTTIARCQGVIGIDPFLVMEFNRIVFATDAKIVLSSSWRNWKGGVEEIEKRTMKMYSHTPYLDHAKATRGDEIEEWLRRQKLKSDFKVDKYAILDDDSDFYSWQPLFKTTWEKGLTEEIANQATNHLNS